MKFLRYIFLSIPAALYGAVVFVRNWLFDKGIIKSQEFVTPTICVGNITVGGTGKTPHIEYLIRLLRDKNVAVLSRGYKRKTKGFVLATNTSTAAEIGDEPLQMHQKFANIRVAVCEKRAVGISNLLKLNDKPDVILLDDAMQHRYVTPTFTIALVDSNRPTYADHFLPLGRLRDSRTSLQRANCVIVTKCKTNQNDEHEWRKKLKLRAEQQLFFSTFAYGMPMPIFKSDDEFDWCENSTEKPNVLVVTGIASPQSLLDHTHKYANDLRSLQFADHHDFTLADIQQIEHAFAQLATPKIILTTEKDRSRLQTCPFLSDELKRHFYAIGIEVRFCHKQNEFDQLILQNCKKK